MSKKPKMYSVPLCDLCIEKNNDTMNRFIKSSTYAGILLIIFSTYLNAQTMDPANSKDLIELSKLNAQFISNFIHPDFICIESSGEIVNRKDYMTDWANGYTNSGYKTFGYSDENIRIFGDMALIRSKTTYTKEVDGILKQGFTIYTDTYVKEKGTWKCVQAHITPLK
jgi:hypothetical protein